MNNLFKTTRGNKTKEEQCGLKNKAEQTVKSLKEVENFLNQTKKAINHIKLYKILK